jgi:hypothetical protein
LITQLQLLHQQLNTWLLLVAVVVELVLLAVEVLVDIDRLH